MGVQFNHPWVLLLLILAAAGAFYAYRSDFRLHGGRKKWAVGLRVAIVILLILALAGFQTFTWVKNKEVVFLIDRSASMEDTDAALAWAVQAAGAKGEQDSIAVVSAGLDGAIEKNLDPLPLSNGGARAEVNAAFTHLEKGLQLAGSLFGGQGNQRIVVISDGEENVGDALSAARMLKERGIAVDVLQVPSKERKDVAVESLHLPEKLYRAESFTFEVAIRSTFSGSGELRLYEDNREIGRKTVALERGENRFALQGLAKEPGLHRYKAEIFMDGDEQAANNESYAFTRVTGSPKVLIVEGKPGTTSNLENALKSGLIQYAVTDPGMLPVELAKYAGYDSIIFNNVSGEQVGGKQMELIEQAVRSYGIGFMMVGGEESFGMGGYFKTPIEKLLPVSMELQGKREIPSLGLVLVIDRSGSMEGDKIRLAKESAMRTVELLRSKDTVGVVAFDDRPWWVVEPTKLGNQKDDVIAKINSIPSAGGTDIYPAVAEATDKLLGIEAQRKHIILLTDGQSAVNSGYTELLSTMNDNHMTMSTVAVGDGADTQLLESLARGAKGRYYFVKDATTLPTIFSREAAVIARTYIVDKPFVPAIVQPGDWRESLSGGLPTIYGYVAASAKSTAQTVLASPEPDPLLARWQYGSGRTVAWTSDLTGKWSRDWVSWPGFPDAFADMVKWTFPQFSAAPFEVSTTVKGNEVYFEVAASEGVAPPDELEAVISGEDLNDAAVPLIQTSPGIYSGVTAVREPGSFLLHLQGKRGDEVVEGGGTGTGFVIPYSPEYRIVTEDAGEQLAKLADLTGGRVLAWEELGAAFDFPVQPHKSLRSWERALLIAALLLWLADIAVRRLALPWGRMAERLAAAAMPWRRRGGTPAAAEAGAAPAGADAGLARLAARKARTASFYGAEGGGDTIAPGEPAPRTARPPAGGTGGEPAGPAPRARPASPPQEEAGGTGPGAAEAPGEGTLGRLLEAKRRGRR
ncbi:VWA domain-containing protein [Paenibacillus woosongensis]|uniref:VWA domain-containing protein n=1 Tax=Paenibacillus woosongensis TaxID=307580 RepID=A0AA95I9G6_9BACL|nr:VWA domain-containing protein [Paenibacillus woosongensis]WHX50437.1 VWA domain-containing protein [Paenibacillus woosongensis]